MIYKRLLLPLIIVALFLSTLTPVFAQTKLLSKEKESELYAFYQSPEGIRFESYSKHWDVAKLKELYALLMKNPHAEELRVLHAVRLKPEEDEGKLGDFEGLYLWGFQGKPRSMLMAVINLYYADKHTTPEEMSLVLGHEYGHIFTYYWMIKKENKLPSDPTSEWAKIRQLAGYPVRWHDNNLPYEHFWQPEEIMADDYMVLFGAPEGKSKLFYKKEMGEYSIAYADMIENFIIPAAESIPELRVYWEEISGISVESPPHLNTPRLTAMYVQKEYRNEQANVHYVFNYSPATADLSREIQYFVQVQNRKVEQERKHRLDRTPLVNNYEPILYDGWIPKGKAAVRLYAYDPKTYQLTYSPMYWYDFTDPLHPVPIADPLYAKPLDPSTPTPTERLVSVHVDGRKQLFDPHPIKVNGYTLVPLEQFVQAMGAQLEWQDAGRVAFIWKDDEQIAIGLNKQFATVTTEHLQQNIWVGQPLSRPDGTVMVPLRMVAGPLGATIRWEQSTRSVFIYTE
jgi:hypothetical protein